jgi:RecB family endonuclease NucS
MFYKIKNSQLEEIGKREILERDVQRLVEANLDLLFGLEFVDTELSIENVRFDTLAFDKESNAPIIIEFKKTFEKSRRSWLYLLCRTGNRILLLPESG